MSDVIIVGAGLAGLVAAHEAVARGRKVLLLDQEGPQSLGGQAFWSLGGLFMVDTPEQRRMGIRDSYDLALADWMGAALSYHLGHWHRRCRPLCTLGRKRGKIRPADIWLLP